MYGPASIHVAVERLLAYLSSDKPLPMTCGDAAKFVGCSQSHLQHLLRHQLGRSYVELRREARAHRAYFTLVSSPGLTIGEVAEVVGCTTRTMGRDLHKLFAVTPSQLRRDKANGARTLPSRFVRLKQLRSNQ